MQTLIYPADQHLLDLQDFAFLPVIDALALSASKWRSRSEI